MKKIILIIFTVFLLASCAMEDVSNNSSDSEIGVRAASVSAGVDFTSNANSDITFDSSCLFRKVDFTSNANSDITFDSSCLFRKFVLWPETEAAHAAGIQGPDLLDGSFGSY